MKGEETINPTFMQSFFSGWGRSSLATKLSIVSAGIALVNIWLGVVVCLTAAWAYTKENPFNSSRGRTALYFLPVLLCVAYLSEGISLPEDDLLRHITAWRVGYDYRAQYPWSDLPKANLWLGFDYLLGLLQHAGLSKHFLLQWIPGLAFVLQAVVVFGVLRRVLAKRQHHNELFLLAGALGLLIVSPRALLGRPEAFLLIFGAAAAMCRSRLHVAAWLAGYLVLIPGYWLGWVYAPFALLLAPDVLKLRHRIFITAALGLIHLAFWQYYTGDYLGLMLWLRGTLIVRATENAPLLEIFSSWTTWVFVGILVFVLSTLNKRRALESVPYLLLLIWFCLPNQIRYFSAVVIVMLPWLYRNLALLARRYRARIHPVIAFLGLAMLASLTVGKTTPVARFALGADARVYSQSPYATVFYGEPGISVEPSFALGATKPEWRNLLHDGVADCARLQQGNFTHVIENTLVKPLECGEVTAVQKEWRLWTLRKIPAK